MFNQVILIGRVCGDVVIKTLPDGKKVGEFTLAVNRPFKNGETGEYDTDFLKINVWQAYAQTAETYCKKGSTIGVKGRITTRKLEIDENTSISIPEINADNLIFINLSEKE